MLRIVDGKNMSQPIFRSFRRAWRGCLAVFQTESNFRLQTLVAALVIVLLVLLPIAKTDRAILLVATALVLVLELVNTAIERVVDVLQPKWASDVRDIKDMMAGAVLLASGVALFLGIFLLGPSLFNYMERL